MASREIPYVEEPIVEQSHREQDAVAHLGLPARAGIEVYDSCASLHAADDSQACVCRPLEWHGTSRGRKVPEHLKPDLIVPAAQVRRNVERIVIPD